MKITNVNVMKVESNVNDRATIDMAQILLNDILNYLEETCGNCEKGVTLYDPTTGEIVTEEELMRAKGILDFFYYNKVLEIQC